MCLIIIIIIPLFTLGSIYSTDTVTIGFALPSAKSGTKSLEGIRATLAYEKQGGKLTQSSLTRLASKTGIRHGSIVLKIC